MPDLSLGIMLFLQSKALTCVVIQMSIGYYFGCRRQSDYYSYATQLSHWI